MTQIPTLPHQKKRSEPPLKSFKPDLAEEVIVMVKIIAPASRNLPTGYFSDRLSASDMRADVRLTHQQTLNCYAVMRGLQERGILLNNGGDVKNKGDVFRWFLDNLEPINEKLDS